MSEKSKEDKRKLVEKAAERLAEILIMQVELSRKENPVKSSGLDSKEDTTISSQ